MKLGEGVQGAMGKSIQGVKNSANTGCDGEFSTGCKKFQRYRVQWGNQYRV